MYVHSGLAGDEPLVKLLWAETVGTRRTATFFQVYCMPINRKKNSNDSAQKVISMVHNTFEKEIVGRDCFLSISLNYSFSPNLKSKYQMQRNCVTNCCDRPDHLTIQVYLQVFTTPKRPWDTIKKLAIQIKSLLTSLG